MNTFTENKTHFIPVKTAKCSNRIPFVVVVIVIIIILVI